MEFPLGFWELGLWLAFTTIILLVTLELTSPYFGRSNLAMDRKRLRRIALVLTMLFMITVILRIYEILSS